MDTRERLSFSHFSLENKQKHLSWVTLKERNKHSSCHTFCKFSQLNTSMQAGKINNPKSYRPKKVVDSDNKKNHKIKTKQIGKYQAAVVKIFWLKKKKNRFVGLAIDPRNQSQLLPPHKKEQRKREKERKLIKHFSRTREPCTRVNCVDCTNTFFFFFY
jgi:hypothetical protein